MGAKQGMKSGSQKAETSRAPAVVYQEQSLVAKLLRDLLTEEFSAIRIDNSQEHRRVLALVERIMHSNGGAFLLTGLVPVVVPRDPDLGAAGE